MSENASTMMKRAILLSAILYGHGYGDAHGQCPGVLPGFKWASDGSSVVFTDHTESFGYSVYGHSWDFGDGASGSGPVVAHTYDTAGVHSVTMSFLAGGCGYTAEAIVVHAGANDDCSSTLSSGFISQQTGNNQVAFTDQSQGDGSFLFHYWYFGDDSSSFDMNTQHFYVRPGTYDVTHSIATVDGQFSTVCVAGSVARVPVDGNTSTCDSSLFLDLQLEVYGNQVQCDAQTTVFNDDLVVTGWTWDYGDSTMDVASIAGVNHWYDHAGMMQVCVEVSAEYLSTGSGCSARGCRTVNIVALTGLSENGPTSGLRAWPNPFGDDLWIAVDDDRDPVEWRLVDALGRLAASGTARGPRIIHHCEPSLVPGPYRLMVRAGNEWHSMLLLKEPSR